MVIVPCMRIIVLHTHAHVCMHNYVKSLSSSSSFLKKKKHQIFQLCNIMWDAWLDSHVPIVNPQDVAILSAGPAQ